MQTYELSERQLSVAQSELALLNKKAAKLGTEPITMRIVDSRMVNVEPEGELPRYYQVYDVAVEGTEPVINGWTFIGTVQHEATGNMLLLAPNAPEIDTRKYRTGTQKCDHCGKIRDRKDTYLIAKMEDDLPTALREHVVATYGETFTPELKQVGKNCLRDFLGHGDPDTIVSMIAMLQDFINDLTLSALDDSFGGRGYGSNDHSISLVDYMRHVAAMVNRFGFVSKGKAHETMAIATADRAASNMHDTYSRDKKLRDKAIKPNDEDEALAEAAIKYCRTVLAARPSSDWSDYENNLIVACADDYIQPRSQGIVASLISMFLRERGKEIAIQVAKESNPSTHVGIVGKRYKFEHVRVTKVMTFENAYGESHMMLMVDRVGNVFKWSSKTLLQEGETYTITGSIKEHSEYHGIKQTVLTRCKAEEE